VSELRTGIDELDIDLLQVTARRVLLHALPQHDRAFLDADDGALQHDPIFLHLSVVDEPAHGGDGLLRQIGLGLARRLVALLTDPVYLFVELGTVEVPVLTGAGDRG